MSEAPAPPHDLHAEQALIGAAILDPDVMKRVTIDGPEFYRPMHEEIWGHLTRLNGDTPDRAMGLLDALRAGGWKDATIGPYIHTCLDACHSPASAEQYARAVSENARLRTAQRVIEQAARAVATEDLDLLDSALYEAQSKLEGLTDPSRKTTTTSWEALDLEAVLAGGELDPPPDLMPRTDGGCLGYEGHVHSIAGESNTGKTWIALHAAAAVLGQGQRVVFLDFEDRASRVVGRLVALGADHDRIRDHFMYVRPNRAISPQGKQTLERLISPAESRFVILDGVTEAMTMHGLEPVDKDIAQFYELLPRWVADYGPAVFDLDHVVKNRKEQGRYATGGQHKLSGIDGAAYIARIIEPIGRGHKGRIKLTIAKDRPGYVGKVGEAAAEFILDATDDTKIIATLEPPEAVTTAEDGTFRPTNIMQKVSAFLQLAPGSGMKEIKEAKLGQWIYVQKAVHALVTEEYVSVEQIGRKHEHHNLRPFTEHDDPIDGQNWYDREPPEDETW